VTGCGVRTKRLVRTILTGIDYLTRSL